MGTKIAWASEVWNVVTGCTPVSPGCKNCYAAKMAKRLRGRHGYPADEPFRVTFRPDRLDQPKCWRKPHRIFVVSMGDMWHKDVTPAQRRQIVLAAMAAPQHTYLFLTKRIVTAMNEIDFLAFSNFWLGTSVENQAAADERVWYLMQCKAAVRYISYEPALGPVNWNFCQPEDVRLPDEDSAVGTIPCPTGKHWQYISEQTMCIDWLICGAESIGSRPGRECQLSWIESAVEQAKAAGIPCFVKQIHLRVGGKLRLVKDVSKFPKHLQIQEYPR